VSRPTPGKIVERHVRAEAPHVALARVHELHTFFEYSAEPIDQHQAERVYGQREQRIDPEPQHGHTRAL